MLSDIGGARRRLVAPIGGRLFLYASMQHEQGHFIGKESIPQFPWPRSPICGQGPVDVLAHSIFAI
jgi:hypothetical protein